VSALTSRSNVLLCWQGRYEILSLSGSYLLQDTGGGARQRTGGLSVSLAATDGRVIGGSVAGLLVAASPIQVSMQWMGMFAGGVAVCIICACLSLMVEDPNFCFHVTGLFYLCKSVN
jgi:hypothetical protein